METIKCAYASHDLDSPQGRKGHQTKKQAISIADMAGVDTTTVALFSTFAKYYRFNLIANTKPY